MIISEDKKIFMLVFGTGDIIMKSLNMTNTDTGVNYFGIGFSQIEEGEVGRQALEYKDIDLHQPVKMIFSNSKSVGVVIEGLEVIKNAIIKREGL